MSERDIAVGSRIKGIRQNKKITQKELAEKLGISQTAIALWESGNRSVSLNAIDDIAGCLGVSAGYLLFGDLDINDEISQKKVEDDSKEFTTIAAHLGADELTEAELEDVKNYIEFVKSKRKDPDYWKKFKKTLPEKEQKEKE
ncbi:helix-turn-helix domain-containing protein [Muricomes sp. OA1]|jgi:transcriptional regulator with XRE-family HTH domain|uniref:helix-turn-helix domain-containing protein n=1 Tax=Muricomes sp. OA1 TaxID=2914165 RepID=UPI0004AD1EB0|nr:helix-turn-helix transcriptional regulator [Muricomes sp. OA1]MCH1974158.1 helix-turn-helix domain-containing protein [Muricomes sp. OA1]